MWLAPCLSLASVILARAFGPELIADPSSGSGTNWLWDAVNAEWDKTVAGINVLTIAAPDLEVGATYRIAFEVRHRTAGSVTPRLAGGTVVPGTAATVDGSYAQLLVAVTGNTDIGFSSNGVFNVGGSVGAISLRKVL